MQYVIFVYENGDEPLLYTGPVQDSDASYLRRAARYLKPLSDNDYITGPVGLLAAAAKFSYILDGTSLFWCIEWEPGLVIVKMAPNAEMSWVALRSPIPNFGGREPLPDDGDSDEYDEDDNPQYNLVFTAWDAQFDKQNREWNSFIPADATVRTRFNNGLACANGLGGEIESRSGGDREKWFEICKANLAQWSGDGVRNI